MGLMCAVHLIRKANGLAPLETFLKSYQSRSAGMEHDLVIVFKGFDGEDLSGYAEVLRPHRHRPLFVPDRDFDIGPYFRAVKVFDYQYFVFLNSYSTILCDDWMAKLYQHARQPDVGAAGATGSWESLPRARAGEAPRGWLKRLRFRLKQARALKQFPDFPSYHLRTNAFMGSRETLRRVKVPALRTKKDAHRFESGTGGLTSQLLAMNTRVLVVGCDGKAYEKEQWPSSRTFRTARQDNLLVADNQTRLFDQADEATRRKLAALAWGSPEGAPAR